MAPRNGATCVLTGIAIYHTEKHKLHRHNRIIIKALENRHVATLIPGGEGRTMLPIVRSPGHVAPNERLGKSHMSRTKAIA